MLSKWILARPALVRPIAGVIERALPRLGMCVLYVPAAAERLLPADAEPVKEFFAIGDFHHLDRINQPNLPLDGQLHDNRIGENGTVYVVDTGVSVHRELAGRLLPGFNSTPSSGSFGRLSVLGVLPIFGLLSGSAVDPKDTADRNGHGTHVATLAAGLECGSSRAKVVPVKVLDDRGSGTTDWILEGLEWIAGQRREGEAQVVNASLGGGISESLDEGFRRLKREGFRVVVAAGNENRDASVSSPARVKELITVGAVGQDDARASFSNYGSVVDLWAPGVDIRAGWFDGGYRVLSGTSMAAPIVSGLLAAYDEQTLLAMAVPLLGNPSAPLVQTK